MVLTFSKKSKIAFVYFGKRPNDKKEGEKLSSLDPKVSILIFFFELFVAFFEDEEIFFKTFTFKSEK